MPNGKYGGTEKWAELGALCEIQQFSKDIIFKTKENKW